MPPKAQNLPLPDDDHVLRFASSRNLHRDESGAVIALLPQAFRLRDREQYLSVTWVEYFSGDSQQQKINGAVQAFRRTMNAGPSSAFGMAEVGAIKKACSDYNLNVRILHEPSKDNPGHAAIRRYRSNGDELLELLATDVFARIVLNERIPDTV